MLADVTIPHAMLEGKLHTTAKKAAETCFRKNLVGSAMALSYGFNAHMANMIAALYLATGQDPAQVVEGSMGMTTAEIVEDGLYLSVRIPCIEVGTVDELPFAATVCRQALSMIDCVGSGKAKKLAEIVGAVVLAGELSTLAAQSAGELGKAHKALGR